MPALPLYALIAVGATLAISARTCSLYASMASSGDTHPLSPFFFFLPPLSFSLTRSYALLAATMCSLLCPFAFMSSSLYALIAGVANIDERSSETP